MKTTRLEFLNALVATVAALSKGPLRTTLKDQAMFGSYISGFTPDFNAVKTMEGRLGKLLEIVSWFVSWGVEDIFSAGYLASVGNRIPLIAVEPWSVSRASVLNGSQDRWLRGQAEKAITYGKAVYIRPWHESNSDWYDWSLDGRDGTPTEAINAWRHVVNLFRDAGATDVKFVFCINTHTVGGAAPSQYWPGSFYVDILGVDGYSWDQGATSFDEVMADGYKTLTALDSTLDVWVCETGCGEGRRKAAWINAMFASARFPRFKGLSYFSLNSGRQDWSIDSSAASLAAFKANVRTTL